MSRIADHPWHWRPDLVYKTGVLLPFDPTADVPSEMRRTVGGFVRLLTRAGAPNDSDFTTRRRIRTPGAPPASDAEAIADGAEKVAAILRRGKAAVVEAPGERAAVIGPRTAPPQGAAASAIDKAARIVARGRTARVEVGGAQALATPRGAMAART